MELVSLGADHCYMAPPPSFLRVDVNVDFFFGGEVVVIEEKQG